MICLEKRSRTTTIHIEKRKQTLDGKLGNRLEVLLVLIRFIRLAICIGILHNEAIIWRHASKLEWSEKVNVWGARARKRARAQSFIFLTEWDCNSLVSWTIMRMIEREREAKRRGEEKQENWSRNENITSARRGNHILTPMYRRFPTDRLIFNERQFSCLLRHIPFSLIRQKGKRLLRAANEDN